MKRSLIIFAALLIACAIWWCSRSTPPVMEQPAPSAGRRSVATTAQSEQIGGAQKDKATDSKADSETSAKALVSAAYNTPIAFWGKAVDETGQPVSGASVHFVASDKFFGDGSDYDTTTDATGLFSLTGVKGLSISVNVQKPGYYRIENQSHATVAFGYRTASKDIRPPPTKDKPTVFILRKARPSEGLVKTKGWRLALPQDGTPTGIRLEGVNTKSSPARAHLVIETHLDLSKINQRNEFPWRCRISVPGGGLVERGDKLSFEAPETGYRSEEIIAMTLPGVTSEYWGSRVERDFFLKLTDEKFGRLHIDIHISDIVKDNTIYYQGAWAPNGSRNLEVGPDELGNPR